MQDDGLSIRPSGTSPEQLAAYAGLLGQVFGAEPKFSADAIAWRYAANPAGQVVGADAWDGDRLAAHYVATPLEAAIDGQVIKGLLSLNTATHPDYQGRGLFTRLAQDAYAQGQAAGYGFVIGVANANSTPGFLRKLAFQNVGPLDAGLLLRTPKRFDAAPVQYRAAWNETALRWRLSNPAGHYRLARHGGLTGVWARTHLPLVRCAAFLAGDVAEAEPVGAAPVGATLFLGLEPGLDLAGHGFVALPQRFRPSPLNLIWRALADRAPKTLNEGAVALNFLDFDPY